MNTDLKPEATGPIINSDVGQYLKEVRESGILDYRSESLPTWCPGCGYYGITHGITQALAELHIPGKDLVFVSGIGCAGRYPFFMKGYGFHTIHGRTLPIASGIKLANPGLTVIAVGGDGDGLAIGGGHLPHAIRRNIDLTYILFDNGIYGLTKGQASPTTPQGQITATTPFGNPDQPLNPLVLGLAYGASFVATGYAGMPNELAHVFTAAFRHKGFSLVIITTPCVTFDSVNVTWERLRNRWIPVPASHSTRDSRAAMLLAMSGEHYYGILFDEDRPTWEDRWKDTMECAKEKKRHDDGQQ